MKTCNDLLALRSDAYELHDDGRIVLAARRSAAPLVDLDPAYFKLVARLRRALRVRAAVARRLLLADGAR